MLYENIRTWRGDEEDIQDFYKKVEYFENEVRPAMILMQKQIIERAENGDFDSFVDALKSCRDPDLITFEYKEEDNILRHTALAVRVENNTIYYRLHGQYTDNELFIHKNNFIRLIKIEKI